MLSSRDRKRVGLLLGLAFVGVALVPLFYGTSGAVVGAVAGGATAYTADRFGWGFVPASVYVLLLALNVLLILSRDGPSDAITVGSEEMIFLLFLALILLLNALLDWISLGATRWLLNRIADGTHRGIGALA